MKRFRQFILVAGRGLAFLLILCAPISTGYLVRDPVAIPAVAVIELLLVAVGCIALSAKSLRLSAPKVPSMWAALGLFTVGVIWSVVHTAAVADSLGLLITRFALPLAAGGVGYLLLHSGALSLRDIARALVGSLVIMSVWGILQVIGVVDSANEARVTGPYPYPNTFARILIVHILLLAPLLVRTGLARVERVWLGVALGGGVITLLGTQSYNGWGSFIVGLGVLVALSWTLTFKLRLTALTIGLLLIGAVLASAPSILPSWEVRISESRGSRLEYWHVAREVITRNPWTGIGIKAWEQQYGELVQVYPYRPFPPYNWISPQPHNVALDALLKGGVPMLIGVGAFLAWPVGAALWLVRKRWWPSLGLAAAACALVVFGVIDDPLWSDDMMPFLMLGYAVTVFAIESRGLPKEEARQVG